MRDRLVRPPSDLTALSRSNGGSFPETMVYQIIDGRRVSLFHGSREMPMWGLRFRLEGDSERHAQRRLDSLVRFLEHVQILSE